MGKKRVALIIGYNGIGYRGSQINKDENTVEKTVCDRIAELRYISERNAEDYSKVGLQRSSRTDKGVHAAMLVLSLKIEVDKERNSRDLEMKLREALAPHGIHLHRVVETTKGFDPKARCESRVYEYFVPEEAYSLPEDTAEKVSERRAVLVKALKSLEGTHNFHNFTAQNQEKGPNRYIKEISVEAISYGNSRWERVTLHGQSFMIHQIRKMIGFSVLCARKAASESDVGRFLSLVFCPEKRNIPKTPGEFLLLSHSYFTNYNERFGGERGGAIDSAGCEEYKRAELYPIVCTRENADKFRQWLEVLDKHPEEFAYMELP
ncbi:tRNA pseudouridine38-40 synthase [Nematocida major]|uniref:tRNA pseudouridine38-40 synthase n=1 Tax=Nematocida major TaxID=1912982 RepID=UPI002007C748|nr:tRNA pseudouridine38-40 synthase [Nematocida major]KAH9385736.1 tRNA pseudouridine38-40 synthase [Nematocida major]